MAQQNSPPQFTITQAGLAAALSAEANGLKIIISTFKVSTGVGYEPSFDQTALKGVVAHTGTPTAVNVVGPGVLDVVCVLDYSVGPFKFGDIGLFLDDGTLFAVATYSSLQDKATAAVNGVSNKITYHCLLAVTQGISLFQVSTNGNFTIPTVADCSYVTGPAAMINAPNAIIVDESVAGSDNLYLTRVTGTRWMLHNFAVIGRGNVLAITNGNTVRTATTMSAEPSVSSGQYAVQDNKGNVRLVSSLGSNGAVMSKVIPGLAVGSPITLYRSINTPL